MDLRPGALLGLPAGVPSVVFDAAYWRDLLVVLALAAGWMVARRRDGWALALALAWAVLAVGFWTLAMGRPYGVLQDPATTAWAAEVSVAAHAGGDDGFLAGEPARHRRWTSATRRAGARTLLLAPTLLPLAVLPAIALLVALLWGRPWAALAAILWLAASTLDLDAVRGLGLVPALWSRPAVGVAVASAVAGALALGRRLPRPPVAAAAAAVLGLLCAALVGGPVRLGPAETIGIALFDGIAWVVLGAIGLWSRRDPAALGLAAGGAGALLLAAAGLADAVVAGALYRAGLVLAATPVIAGAAERAGEVLRLPLPRGRAWTPDGAAVRGGIVAVALAGSFLTWWDPPRMDPLARASLEPVPEGLAEAMRWVRSSTDPGGAFVAGEDYAPAVAVLGGRRVVRAPTLLTAPDEERRLRAERAVLSGRRVDALLSRYGVRYVLLAPGQFRAHRLAEPWAVESAGYPLLYQNRSGLRILEVPR
jgi:hypothetical protein